MGDRALNCFQGGFKALERLYSLLYFPSVNGNDLGREVGVPNRIRLIYDSYSLVRFVLNGNKAGRESHVSSLIYRPVGFSEEPPIEPDNVDTDGRGLGAIPAVIDRIVVEPEFESLDETLEYVPKWVESFRLKPVIVFSGNKSLHLHFLIKPVPLNYEDGWFDALTKAFVRWLAKPLKPSTKRKFLRVIDWNVMREKSMHRIPYSLNTETGKCATLAVIDGGSVRFVEDINEALRIVASMRRVDITWLVDSVNAQMAREAIYRILTKPAITSSPSRGCRNQFIEALLNAKGLEDGRWRSLFYFIIPYLVTCQCRGLSRKDCLRVVKGAVRDWLARQGVGDRDLRDYLGWVVTDAKIVIRRGLKPWSLRKVLEKDPGLADIYRRHGLLWGIRGHEVHLPRGEWW